MGTSDLCGYSHLFVLSRFQAPHMDRCFPFHSSELELDGKLLFGVFAHFFVFSPGPGRLYGDVMTLLCSFNLPLCNSPLHFFSLIFSFFFTTSTAALSFILRLHSSHNFDCRFWQFVLSSFGWHRASTDDRLSLLFSFASRRRLNDLYFVVRSKWKKRFALQCLLGNYLTMHVFWNWNRYIIIVHYIGELGWCLSAGRFWLDNYESARISHFHLLLGLSLCFMMMRRPSTSSETRREETIIIIKIITVITWLVNNSAMILLLRNSSFDTQIIIMTDAFKCLFMWDIHNYSRNTSWYMISRVKNKNYWISNWLVDPSALQLISTRWGYMYTSFTKCL